MTDRKEIEIQGKFHRYGYEDEACPLYSKIFINYEDDCIVLHARNDGRLPQDEGFFDTPEQIDEIIKALETAKGWLNANKE